MNSSPTSPQEEIMRRQYLKEFVKEHPQKAAKNIRRRFFA
jgi:hypothetical protein